MGSCRREITISFRLPALAALMLATPPAAAQIAYPDTARVDQVDTLHGERVADPYRWLENDVRQDAQVKAWVDAQNRVTDGFLETLPGRARIAARLKTLWNFEKFGVPRVRGARIFFTRNAGLQNQFALYAQDGTVAEPRLLIDPNAWSKDGATALGEWSPSRDGRLVAYSVQDGGSDWRTVKVLDAATGLDTSDRLDWVKFSGLAWNADGSGFYYSRFPAPQKGAEFQSLNLNHKVYFHRLGTAQSADVLIYATPEQPKLLHSVQTSDDGRWLLIYSAAGTDERYEVTAVDLAGDGKPHTLIKGFDHSWALAGTDGGTMFMVTNRDAPRYRLVALDAASPGTPLRQIVAEGVGTIDAASLLGNRLMVSTLEDAKSVVRSYALNGGAPRTLALPGIGTATGFEGDADSPVTYYSYSSFNAPPTIYRYDASANRSTVFKAPSVPFDASQYEVKQIFFISKDGTRVPMFVAHRRGLDLATGAPTLLYGYGGFNVSLTPSFSVSRLAWMEMGGVLAVANLRGGGEYGKAWHDAGRLANKQNVFDDFIGAGEALVKAGITTPRQLAIQGGSNGGLLVGAVVNQRPDLFAAALPAVGVMDMLRFSQFTAGRYWTDDYGDPADLAAFRALRAYSPYHNIRAGQRYPAILVTTADTDDRVVPGHSFKYTAALQSAKLGDQPHLIRIETRAGHGAGKPTDKIIAEAADQWAFIARFTGLESQPFSRLSGLSPE